MSQKVVTIEAKTSRFYWYDSLEPTALGVIVINNVSSKPSLRKAVKEI